MGVRLRWRGHCAGVRGVTPSTTHLIPNCQVDLSLTVPVPTLIETDSTKPVKKEYSKLCKKAADDADANAIPINRRKTLVDSFHQITSIICSVNRAERKTGAKNAQLVYVSGTSPRKPSTPQLLRILEETIQKKPKPLFHKPLSARGLERYRLLFNIAEKTADTLFQYRTKFVQYMLTSALYANSAVGKPWEMIGSISEQIVEELLLGCLNEMELRDQIEELYKKETCLI